MGCTSSKENTKPLADQNEQIISEPFRKWLKTNRTQADQYILHEILSTDKSTTNPDDYRPIVSKALDLLSERSDIKTIDKLRKHLQNELSIASSNQVTHTIEIFQQTAEKLRQGQIQLEKNIQSTTPTPIDGELTNTSENKGITSGEAGVALKEALEKARILFYKGKQAAIFANPNGGYDVRIIDENDDALQQDGNLLRSIIVTEVKMRPKSSPLPSPSSTIPPPPPPSAKLLDEREIGDDFRRSIDAALKGLEAIYQTSSPVTSSENANISQIDIQPKLVGAVDDMNEIIVQTVESTSGSQIGDPVPSSSSHQVQQRIKQHLSNQSTPDTNIPSPGPIPPKPSRSFEEHHKPSSDVNLPLKSPSHNVTYTEIIQSESRDGEQSRRFITESYDDLPTKDDEQSTSLKVVTKSEFSKDPTSGEKIMEQSVQIITVKVRNETSTTTNPSPIVDQENAVSSSDKATLSL